MTEESRDVTLIALDIAGFTEGDPDDATQLRLRRCLFEAVQAVFDRLARKATDSDPGPWFFDRGDGGLIVLPGTDTAQEVLGEALPDLVNRLNEDDGVPRAGFTLRLAIHTGRASRDRWGWVGRDVNHVFRLVECDRLRKRASHRLPGRLIKIKNAPQLVLALSEAAYHQTSRIGDPENTYAWRSKGIRTTHKPKRLKFDVKETHTHAWVTGIDVNADPRRPAHTVLR